MSPAEMEQGWGMFLRISSLESFLSLKFLPQSFRYKKNGELGTVGLYAS